MIDSRLASPTTDLQQRLVQLETANAELQQLLAEGQLQVAALRDSEMHYRLLVERLPVGVYLAALDEFATAIYLGNQFEALLGYTLDEWRTDPELWFKLMHPDDHERMRATYGHCRATGEGFVVEYRMLARDGRLVWLHDEAQVIEGFPGDPPLLQGIWQDITARKQAEAELARSSAIFVALNKVGARLQTSLEFNRVLEITGGGLKQLGFTCCLSLVDSTLGALVTVYHSIDPAAAAQAESLLGFAIQGHCQPPEGFFLPGGPDEHSRPVFVPNALPAILAALPGLPRPALEQALVAAGILPDQPILFLPIVATNEMIGVMTVWGAALQQDDVPALSIFAAQAGAAIQNARLFEAVYKSHKQLEALSQRLVEVQEAERRYLARELHDEIGQVLTGIRLVLEMAAQSPAARMTHLAEAQTLVGGLINQVQRLSLDLRPTMLDDLGLLPTLLWHFERYTARTGIRVNFEHTNLNRRFDPLVETAAYRIVQEALTNVARHAGVSEAVVRAWVNGERLGVQVADGGAGFNANAALAAGGSTGLPGMRERATLLGGRWSVESAPGAGTRVAAEFPISAMPGATELER
jgi:PAS domain S-box-containing protein